MTPTERKVVSDALSGLDSVIVDDYVYPHVRLDVKAFGTAIDLYDYRAHGKMVIGKRMLAELLGRPQDYLLSGECYDEEYADEDPISELCRFVDPSDTETPLSTKEKQWLIDTVLMVLDGIGGVGDGDQACMRVARRRIAEVAGHPELTWFRLMMEEDVNPLYFQEYQAVSEGTPE